MEFLKIIACYDLNNKSSIYYLQNQSLSFSQNFQRISKIIPKLRKSRSVEIEELPVGTFLSALRNTTQSQILLTGLLLFQTTNLHFLFSIILCPSLVK